MATSRILLCITETQRSHLMRMKYWTSLSTEYQQSGVGNLLCKDLIQWTKDCKNLWSSASV
eukprot:8745879-Ditylum_brightwellii.AAC.1